MDVNFEQVYKETGERLRLFLLSRYVSDSEVDDLMQEIFLKVHNRLATLKDKAKITGWVFQIARNTVIDHYRKSRGNSSLELPDGVAAEEYAHKFGLEPHIFNMGLKTIINKLPPIYSEAITLTELEGLPQKDLAAKLNISLSGAKSRVQRGRQLLKERLKEFCQFELDSFGNIIDIDPISCPIDRSECAEKPPESCVLLTLFTSIK